MSSPYWPGTTPPPPARPDPPATTNGMSVAALVLGIVGLPMFWALAVPSVLAVVFGSVGLAQINEPRRHQSGRGLAVSGIAMGAVGIVGFLVFIGLAASGVIHDSSRTKVLPVCATRQVVLD